MLALNTGGNILDYSGIADSVLPGVPALGRASRVSFVLRSLTAYKPESRVQINYDTDSVGRASFSELSRSLFSAVSTSVGRPNGERLKLIREIRANCRSNIVPVSLLQKWVAEFWIALRDWTKQVERDSARKLQSPLEQIVLDPEAYDIGYSDALGSIHVILYVDPTVPIDRQPHLLRWLIGVSSDVQRLTGRITPLPQ